MSNLYTPSPAKRKSASVDKASTSSKKAKKAKKQQDKLEISMIDTYLTRFNLETVSAEDDAVVKSLHKKKKELRKSTKSKLFDMVNAGDFDDSDEDSSELTPFSTWKSSDGNFMVDPTATAFQAMDLGEGDDDQQFGEETAESSLNVSTCTVPYGASGAALASLRDYDSSSDDEYVSDDSCSGYDMTILETSSVGLEGYDLYRHQILSALAELFESPARQDAKWEKKMLEWRSKPRLLTRLNDSLARRGLLVAAGDSSGVKDNTSDSSGVCNNSADLGK